MADNYRFGRSQDDLLGGLPRFFYGLRRDDSTGEVYFARVNQLSRNDSVTINNPGTAAENYPDFQEGVDFLEGRDINHNLVYPNLNYEQYRWSDKSVYYYIDSAGELVAHFGSQYTYPTGI
jgi:hypothetical protein